MSDLKFSHGFEHGVRPTKKLYSVTKSDGCLIQEFDGRPAAEVYAEAIGVDMTNLEKNAFGLGMRYPLGMLDIEDNFWIKAPGIIIDKKGVLCAAKVPTGAALYLMDSNPQNLINAAKMRIEKAKKKLGGKIAASVIFSCVMRKALLGKDIEKEIKLVRATLGNSSPFAGFYTYGEQGSSKAGVSGQQNLAFNSLNISDELWAK
jgi:hypothetical protein